MDFEDSGIDSDPKTISPKEPIISFSPEKSKARFGTAPLPSAPVPTDFNLNGRSHKKGPSGGSSSDHRRKRRQPPSGSVEEEVDVRGAGGDRRGLIPPERLAIPNRSHPPPTSQNQPVKDNKTKTQITSTEQKPLVQWDSDESEDELSFFPAAKSRAKLTDNLSVDNLSLSGEEEDLHLAPPQPLGNRRRCPDLFPSSCHIA